MDEADRQDSSRNDPWQSSVDNLSSMGKCLLSQSEFSDVTFKVGKDGQTEDVKGHRVLIAARSSVFATMFYGSLPENNKFVRVDNIEPVHFRLMLEYLYTDDTKGINADNIINMYSVAHTYDIASLKKFCAEKVKGLISMERLGQYVDARNLYEDPVMVQHVDGFIEANAWKLFQKEEYYKELSPKHLLYIWKKDLQPEGPNKLSEVDIFKGAVTWAKAECERMGLPSDEAKNQRQVLGEAMSLMRFPRMTLKEFYGIATQGGILTWEERDQIALYLVNAEGSKLPVGRSLPQQATKNDRIRLPDGRIMTIERDLLQNAIAGKRPPVTCNCNCHTYPPTHCAKAEARCRRIAGSRKGKRTYQVGDWSSHKGVMYKARQMVGGKVEWSKA